MSDAFEERNLDAVLNEPTEPIVIYADSQKTWRICLLYTSYRLGYAEGRAVIYKRYGKPKGIECRHAETPYGSLFGLENSLQQNEHKNIQNA